MKVLFVNTNESYGGAARAAHRIMRGVQKHGVEVQMFVKNRSSQAKDVVTIWEFIPANPFYKVCDWIASKIKNQWQHYKWRAYKNRDQITYLSDLRATYIHGALQKMDYDILHLNWFNQRFLDIDELKKVQKPIVWTLHDSWAFCGICHYFINCEKYQTHCGACPLLKSDKERDLSYELFDRKIKAYKDLDLHIVTPSKWLGECAKKSVILGRFPVTAIPNCLDTDIFRPKTPSEISKAAAMQQNPQVKQVLLEKSNKPVIMFGAINAANDKLKGFNLLTAALRLLDAQGLEARLVVFGAAQYDVFEQFKHIDVVSVGFVQDLDVLTSLYSIADVMVVPSYSEVFGQTASEAMACGTPVVAFRCTGIQDVVAEGCGYLAKPYETDDLANGIRYCIENNKDNIMGKAARESVEKRFAIDVVAKQYKALYESIV